MIDTPFTSRHFFGPKGEIIPIAKNTLHVDHVLDNPKSFGFKDKNDVEGRTDQKIYDHIMKLGYIRAEYYPPMQDSKSHEHNLSYESQDAKPEHFFSALRSLHEHYKKNPGERFEINLIGGDWKSDDRLFNHVKTITGNNQISSLEDIEKIVGMNNTNTQPERRIRKIKRSNIEEPKKLKLGAMPQGSMTDAEYNFGVKKVLVIPIH